MEEGKMSSLPGFGHDHRTGCNNEARISFLGVCEENLDEASESLFTLGTIPSEMRPITLLSNTYQQ